MKKLSVNVLLFAALISSASVFGAASEKPSGLLIDLTRPGDARAMTTTGSFLNENIKPGNAFDNIQDNDTHRIITSNNHTAFDIIYTFDRPTKVDSYQVFLGPVTLKYEKRAPKDWTFEGSNDGTSWTVLDTQTAETGWSQNESRYYKFSNDNPYLKYRFNVSANGGESYTQFAELEFYDTTMTDLTDDDPSHVSSSVGTFSSDSTGPAKAFDNEISGDDHRVLSAKYCYDFDVIYTFAAATKVNLYRVNIGAIDSSVLGRAPKDWSFEGSNDSGLSWTVLDVREGEVDWTVNEARLYYVNNDSAYSSYRIHIKDNNSKSPDSSCYVQFAELELFYDSNNIYKPFDRADYARNLQVEVAGYTGSASLINFPILVRLSTAIPGFSYDDFELPDGGDLRFSTTDNELLDYEIDTWNTNGVSYVWVKIPELSNGCRFVICYGNKNPWKMFTMWPWSEYAGVWHLGASNSNNSLEGGPAMGTKGTVSTAASSLVGAGRTVNGGVCTSTSPMTSLSSVSSCTVSAWIKPSANTAVARLISTKESASGNGLELIFSGSGNTFLFRGDGNSTTITFNNAKDKYANDSWSYFSAVYNGSTGSLYHNGALVGSSDGKYTIDPVSAAGKLYVGCYGGSGNYVVGEIDEIRVYNGVASADWIKAEYDSINNANFLTISQSKKSGVIIIFR